MQRILVRHLIFRRSKLCPIFRSNFANNSQTSSSNEDYYETLGLNKSATSKDIKAAYYELSKKYHPDINPEKTDAAIRFVRITEAYETLGNDEKRRQYDEESMRSSLRNIHERSSSSSTNTQDMDLEMLREFQRKWNLRRQHQHRQRSDFDRQNRRNNNNGGEFDMKTDTEEFEAFYKRYKDNVAKARQWDENRYAGESGGTAGGLRREQYTPYQKSMMRDQHTRHSKDASFSYIFGMACLISFLAVLLGGRF